MWLHYQTACGLEALLGRRLVELEDWSTHEMQRRGQHHLADEVLTDVLGRNDWFIWQRARLSCSRSPLQSRGTSPREMQSFAVHPRGKSW
ncbi:hypothetical protein K456DRAFT_779313 [Colletotrichum gloeosporioides 23]|nr:hypothetical protein K456DRAFT_779313 [Colletotrichum gloeosporioides 23]